MVTPDLLTGKKILITGGGSGLGKSMGQRLVELGAELGICGRRQPVLEETARELMAAFPRPVTWHVCDIRDPAAVDSMIDKI
jgi:short-subunit dehydrogenase involved in D-alanine esterification of teichoic acids